MDDISRVVGRLEEIGSSLLRRFDKLEEKVDQLIALRWKLVGASMVVGGISAVLVEIAIAFLTGKIWTK